MRAFALLRVINVIAQCCLCGAWNASYPGALHQMCVPLEGKANKPDYRTAGAVLPFSIDAESHRSSDAGRFYLHHSEEGDVVALPSVTTSGCASDHVINDASRDGLI